MKQQDPETPLRRGNVPAALLILIACLLTVSPAAAVVISFSDLNLIPGQKITIYDTITEEVLNQTNTSATGIDIGNVSAITIAIQPELTNRWQSPTNLWDDFIGFFLTHFGQIAWIILIIGLFWMWGRRK